MSNALKIGDMVSHKAHHKMPGKTPLRMTVHCFTTIGTAPTKQTENQTSWVICQWFNPHTFDYQRATFHVDELEKV